MRIIRFVLIAASVLLAAMCGFVLMLGGPALLPKEYKYRRWNLEVFNGWSPTPENPGFTAPDRKNMRSYGPVRGGD